MRKFENVDIINSLRRIMNINTEHYKNDFLDVYKRQVYFLNKVDISDLEALAKENSAAVPAAVKASPTPQAQASPSAEPDGKTKTAPKTDKSKSGNSSIMLILIAIIGIGGLGAYYFKVYLPKKNMENAPDLEDFEFTDGEDEETERCV